MHSHYIAVFSEDADLFPRVAAALPEDATAAYVTSLEDLRHTLKEDPALVVVALPPDPTGFVDSALVADLQGYPVVLLTPVEELPIAVLDTLFALSPRALVSVPFESDELRDTLSVVTGETKVQTAESQLRETLADANRRLNARLQEINTIYTVGKSVSASLDADEVLERAVVASVNLTRAEEGFIVLQEGDKLFTRVVKWRNHPLPERLYTETSDSIAQQVIRSGRPAMLHRKTKIATGFFVRALLYVPLQVSGTGTFGILGVVNRVKDEPFTEHQLFTLSSVADFVAIALENARFFSMVETERSRMGAILEHAAEAIIVTDLDNRLWLWSNTAAGIFSLDDEARGQAIQSYLEHDEIRDLFDRAAREPAPVVHTEVTLEGGRVYNAQLSTIEGVGRVAVMQEITHLKELDRLKSEFVSTVSHDLRTPLTTIQGYVELLDRVGPLNEMQVNFIDKALNSLSHITALISDLLDIGRIEAGYDLEMGPIRVGELVETVAEDVEVEAAQADIEIRVDVADAPLISWGNARRLRQVIDNLVNNAIKYNNPGGWVEVHAHRDDDHIIVAISDNGIGIPPEEQPKIFERFYRVQSPETEEVQGTGLGLAIVKSVIEKHKGRVWVESSPGEGSTFAFVLPVHKPDGGSATS
jgi:two-component system NtrC family sensor kinase